ncbi:phage protein [Clostridium sp. FP1]|uniref:phage protein n=1 Tax=Clostridium sp. FP1 TaxID=2724076 RepID=UPI0013E9083D|nr:glucosaminidase domain-containing protein [Clostridium sp. FP1]MBZ9633079.1 glucosaminidase domain-containing protein [Clostridium sp. FP1]
MSNQDFINSVVPGAKKGYTTYHIFPSITIAQAINESGWGGSRLTKTDNNLFGIKYPGNHDPSIKISKGSWATDDGGYYTHYESVNDSILDHGYFLKNNPRYAAAISAKTYSAQIKAIADAGYATESDYYAVTMQIVKDNNLTQYDTGGSSSTASTDSSQLDVISTNFEVVQNSLKYGNVMYGRRCRITVSDAKGNAFDISMLRCTFSIVDTMIMEPNCSQIVIYNLSAETENSIMMNATRVTVEAGYEGAQFGLIFDGDILQTIRDKPDGATYELTIIALDGDKSVNFDIANYSVLKGQTARTLVEHITNNAQYPVSLGSISKDLESSGTLTRGKVFFGKSSDYLRQIAQSNSAQYYTKNGQINIIKMTDLPDGQIFDLSVSSGLLGTPQQTDYGISAQCLLNPAIKINTLIHIDGSLVRAKQISLTASNSIPSSGTATGSASTTSSAGATVRNKILAEAKKICDDPNTGYSQSYRNQTINGKTYYDCSSFVKHCYAVAGLSLDDITGPQWIQVQPAQGGRIVTLSDAQPGDLVFWFNNSGCYHIALYAGNNNIYAASTSSKPFPEQVSGKPIYGQYKIGRIKALISSDAGQAPSAVMSDSTDTGTQSPIFRSLDKDGIYRIIKVTYTGDTRGTDWQCDFETISQAGGVIAAVAN